MLSQMDAGVVRESDDDRITRRGPRVGGEAKRRFSCVASSVPPAMLAYSPPLREVGMLMMGMVGGVGGEGRGVGGEVVRLARSERVETALASAFCDRMLSFPCSFCSRPSGDGPQGLWLG